MHDSLQYYLGTGDTVIGFHPSGLLYVETPMGGIRTIRTQFWRFGDYRAVKHQNEPTIEQVAQAIDDLVEEKRRGQGRLR